MTAPRLMKPLVLSIVLVGLLAGVVTARRALAPTTLFTSKSALATGGHHIAHQTGVSHDTSRHSLTLAINGRDNPELISDDVAYRHLIAATAPSDQHDDKQKALWRGRMAKIGLTERDARHYEDTLRNGRVRDELTRIAENRKALEPSAAQRLPSTLGRLRVLREEEDNLLRDARQLVVQGLTPEGAATLDKYVQTFVKLNVRIYRNDMSMSK